MRWRGKPLGEKSPPPPHFSHTSPLSLCTLCPQSPAFPLFGVRHSRSVLPFYWVRASRDHTPSILSFIYFTFYPAENPRAIITMTFWPINTLLLCHFVAFRWQTPITKETFYWSSPGYWYQSSWALPEKVNKAGGRSHRMFLTPDFKEASTLPDNPTTSLVGMLSLQLFAYFKHFLLPSVSGLLSHLCSNPQLKTLSTVMKELFPSGAVGNPCIIFDSPKT